ncbi:MAG: hypothetical protein OXT09_33035 [Myxococcales bacterium]|nr:hypothetical protein [Myxococcales bacterium]
MSGRSAHARTLWPLLLLLAALVLIWLARTDATGERGRLPSDTTGQAREQAAAESAEAAPAPSSAPTGERRSVAEPTDTEPSPDCQARVEWRCHAGDVYWFDSCGEPGTKHEECGQSLCRGADCKRGDPDRCASLPLEGVCRGNVAVGCVGGVPYAVDCAARGKRCAMLEEGAQCASIEGDLCDLLEGLPRCHGDVLVSCSGSERRERDCAVLGGLCGAHPDTGTASCLVLEPLEAPPDPTDACGPCGCGPGAEGEAGEGCNGLDDDGDGVVDEQIECEAIELVAFIVADGQGRSSYAREDIEREVERINRTFDAGTHELGLRVVLADVVTLEERDWLEVGDRELDDILRDPRVRAPRERLFVPVVFTDTFSAGDTPKVGVATLPNGHCGGRRVSDHPEPSWGGVVVAKGRSPTTTAHEIGHFLGLCHTHFASDDAPVRVVTWRAADGSEMARACGEPCVLGGDGICDTPPDPGPEGCGYDATCQVRCTGAERPDPFNVMSYYTACRHVLSELQAREMRRTLALRRAWHACELAGGCPCHPLTSDCPEQMTCRPAGDGIHACGLDGPRLPGEPCEHHQQCGAGSLCASGECRLPCGQDGPSCRCKIDSTLGIGLCS